MRVKVTYIDTHFGDGLTSVTYPDVPDVETAVARWLKVHMHCCDFVNAHRT